MKGATATTASDTAALVTLIVGFLTGIGLEVRFAAIAGATRMPGVTMEGGALLVDRALLLYPGDVLHEAGHLATVSPAEPIALGRDAGGGPAGEMMAIAWSYAAAVHLALDAAIVFHAGGYRGGSEALVDNFTQGRYVGVPMLQWIGLTLEPKAAAAAGAEPYPSMVRWTVP
jgi:hypothetical protein